MRPAVAHTTLFSYLVTRPTGRTVRATVERQIADADRAVLAVLDLRHVPVIDFSCADEIVAKLVLLGSDASPRRSFILFRGIAEHHLGPIDSVLRHRGLAAAAENTDGEPLLMGALDPGACAVWREIWSLGRTGASPLADRLELPLDRVRGLLDDLVARALVIRDGERYVSLHHALLDAEPQSPAPADGGDP